MLVYSHLPQQPDWQLLRPAVTHSDFERRPPLKSHFFAVGMRLLPEQQGDRGVVFTRRGVASIAIGFTRPATAFTFRLAHGGDSGTETVQVG